MMCVFRTLHEYRASLAAFGLAGAVTGLIDALVLDWTLKAFMWASVLVSLSVFVAYELTMMPVPDRPMLQSVLLCLIGLGGLVSVHHAVWTATWISLGHRIGERLWLAPNIYADFHTYTAACLALLVAYVAYNLYCSVCSGD